MQELITGMQRKGIMNEQSRDHLCYGQDKPAVIRNRGRRAAYHRTHDN